MGAGQCGGVGGGVISPWEAGCGVGRKADPKARMRALPRFPQHVVVRSDLVRVGARTRPVRGAGLCTSEMLREIGGGYRSSAGLAVAGISCSSSTEALSLDLSYSNVALEPLIG